MKRMKEERKTSFRPFRMQFTNVNRTNERKKQKLWAQFEQPKEIRSLWCVIVCARASSSYSSSIQTSSFFAHSFTHTHTLAFAICNNNYF